ncbi:MAG TPA: HlyD family secretion protein [Steroidobacteraceae bacterium]|jgi:membrane fusion protein (multidrug efflux system)|nr:HlyD family secretion protein [Steroidobacteraceae bacterium]
MNEQTSPASVSAAPVVRERPSATKLIKWGIAAVILVVVIGFGVHYWRLSQLYVSTDNAYVNADRIEMAAQVSGPVTTVWVRDQQAVKAGDVLFEIDPQPYRLAFDAAEAQLELAYQTTSQDRAAVAAARALVAQRSAELHNAQSTEKRALELTEQRLISKQSAETSTTEAQTAAAAVQAAQANLEQAQGALGQAGAQNAAVRAAAAKLAQANLDLKHTRVVAPANGLVANFELRPGSMVQSGVPIFTVIGDAEFWVDANFKETELRRIQPGQKATIEVDMYRDHEFRGEVQSLSGGAGQAFSLLPAQNATGNWVKVTQRVPVRVRVLNPDTRHPLRIGTTATVHIEAPE